MAELRNARLRRGWSQNEVIDEIVRLAELLEERAATRPSLKTLLSRWENGHAVPAIHYRRVLSQVFPGEDLGFRPATDEDARQDLPDHPEERSVLVPVSTGGGIRYVSMRRRDVLAVGLGTAVGLAVGDARGVRTRESRLTALSDIVYERTRTGTLVVTDPRSIDATLKLPDADTVAGAVLPVTLLPTGRLEAGEVYVDLSKEEADRVSRQITPTRLYVSNTTERPENFVVLGRAAGRQIRNSRTMRIPLAYRMDDVTLGILWGSASFDQPLLDDDSLLSRRQTNPLYRDNAVAAEMSDDLTAELSPVSRMWMGSDYCARYIMRNFPDVNAPPRFWTREHRGQEACTWLFFAHKFFYLRRASDRSSAAIASTSRSFCIPESVKEGSPRWERVLLLLTVALMESLGIAVHVCTEPDLADVDGLVMAGGSRALVANWVRASNAWVTTKTADKSLLTDYRDKIAFSIRASVNAGDDPQQRLQSLSAYLGVNWHEVGLRCCELKEWSPSGMYEPRSRLLSFAGLERAVGYIESLHRRCACRRRLESMSAS
jgi:transcriptional regulator with XRE-family HTH domain